MPEVTAHGGRCCGIRHIYGFYGSPKTHPRYLAELDRCIKQVHANRLMEVTLTDGQMNHWWPELQKRGFRQITRFKNSNSGNYVTVLHLIRKPAKLKFDQPAMEFKDTTVSNRDSRGRFISKSSVTGDTTHA